MSADTLGEVRDLRRQIADHEAALRSLSARLEHIQRTCAHDWGEVVYDPIVCGGYKDEGDPPGTMGIDRRLPTYVPRKEKPRWRRTCRCCDLTQYTQATNETVTKTPRF